MEDTKEKIVRYGAYCIFQADSWRTALALGAVAFLSSNQAFASNECGDPVDGVVICNEIGNNPYSGGIAYDSAGGGVVLNVENGIVVNRPSSPGQRGVSFTDTSGAPLAVNIADGVSITMGGNSASGVTVVGFGDISIISAANITVNVPDPPLSSAYAILGWINDISSIGNINITQLESSNITLSGIGIYGLNDGNGSVTLTSSGNVSTSGSEGYGINATNNSDSSISTTVILNASGSVLTDGEDSVGLYSLNEGTGDALIIAHGKVTTMQAGSDGALADIDTATSSGNASVFLSATANIHTIAAASKGAWALNWGLGNATITSAAAVSTDGARSSGLHASIFNNASTADISVSLEGSGSVVTHGSSAHGILAENQGTGAVRVQMGSGTSVTTTGIRANGINGLSSGTMSFMQAASSVVAVSGNQSFGVDSIGEGGASVQLGGTVSSTGQFGVGASSFATTGPAEIAVGANSTVIGGWQADVAGLGVDTQRPSSGVLIGSGVSSQLTNLGIIGAGSDRAIADIGRQAGTAGNLVVDNAGLVTGFIEFAGGGTNVFNNRTSGEFDMRHFADANGDGVHETKRVAISDFGTSTSSFNNFSGAAIRLAPVVGEASTDGAGYYVPTAGIDSRPLDAGYYTLGRSGIVQGQFTNLGTFHNAGIIDLRGSETGNTLVMTANASAGGAAGNGVFISDGGQLLLNTVLNSGGAAGGLAGSFSDVLVVDSTRMGTGATKISIDRREGAGATSTGNGILLVEVRNKAASAPGVFALNGDFAVNGEQALIKGAYYYRLFHNGVAGDSADGNWYLRSLGLAPNIPVYEAYPKVLLSLMNVPTLQQRVGNRYWNEPAPRALPAISCTDTAQNYPCAADDQQARYAGSDGTVSIENTGLWARMEAAHGRYRPSLSTSGTRYDSDAWKFQAGLDGLLVEEEGGKLIGGVTAHYGHVSADVAAAGSLGGISAKGYGLGGTLTWYGTSGFYADAQARATWLDSDLDSATLGQKLFEGNKGFGYTLSLESGQRFESNHWTLIPQAQLVYSNVRFDSFTDPFGTPVSLAKGDSLRGRLSFAAQYQERGTQANGKTSRISGYGIANLYNEFLGRSRVNTAGMDLDSRDDRLWGGLGLGGSYNRNDDNYSIYGEVSANTGLAHFGDSFDVGGTVGMRVRW